MGKYIIELERGETAYKTVNSNGKPMIQLLAPTPYTDPDLEQVNAEKDKIYDEARARGYDEGRARGYQEGLFDAWECARKVMWTKEHGGYGDRLEDVFGHHSELWDVFDYSASEAIEKIRRKMKENQ